MENVTLVDGDEQSTPSDADFVDEHQDGSKLTQLGANQPKSALNPRSSASLNG
jgi:hypothetical protein